jgi:uncharacterized LabA/DUF88 family protein
MTLWDKSRYQGRVAVLLVDGSNLYATAKQLGFSIDFRRLTEAFDGHILRSYYFTARAPAEEQSTIQPMIDWLEFNGWSVIQKEYKEYQDRGVFQCQECGHNNETVTTKIKGNMDIEMAIVAYEMAPLVTDLFMFTGDGDFTFLISSIQRRYATRVSIVSSIQTQPPMCADVLRRQADDFIELASLRPTIERVDRPARRSIGVTNLKP